MSEGGTKHDGGKEPLDLLSSHALLEISKVLGFGAKKYNSHNWRNGISYSRLYAAALRHLLAWNNGESEDPESSISHISHAACNLMFLLEFIKTRPDLDDRYHTGLRQSLSHDKVIKDDNEERKTD
jgi:hypothetical protein